MTRWICPAKIMTHLRQEMLQGITMHQRKRSNCTKRKKIGSASLVEDKRAKSNLCGKFSCGINVQVSCLVRSIIWNSIQLSSLRSTSLTQFFSLFFQLTRPWRRWIPRQRARSCPNWKLSVKTALCWSFTIRMLDVVLLRWILPPMRMHVSLATHFSIITCTSLISISWPALCVKPNERRRWFKIWTIS